MYAAAHYAVPSFVRYRTDVDPVRIAQFVRVSRPVPLVGQSSLMDT